MTRIIILAAGLTLAGCGFGEGIGSWRDAAFSLVTDDETTSLERVLVSAEDTPGNQGLLYTAIVDAEYVSQSATRATILAEQPATVAGALGDVIYALAPAAAPDWDTKDSGLVPGWNGTGYGLIRASDEMAEALRGRGEQGGDAAVTNDALVCIENTAERAREALALAQSLLGDVEAAGRVTLLPQLERLARGLLHGLDTDGSGAVERVEGECGLQQAEDALNAFSDPAIRAASS